MAKSGAGEREVRVETVRRTASGVRATVAIDGYDQVLEIDTPTGSGAAPGERRAGQLGRPGLRAGPSFPSHEVEGTGRR